MQFSHGVIYIWCESRTECGELRNNGVDIDPLPAKGNKNRAFINCPLAHLCSKRGGVEHGPGTNTYTACFVGICRPNAFQRGANFVVAALSFSQGVVQLMPRENEMCLARHFEACTRNAPRLELVDFRKQCGHVDHNTVANDWGDMVVQHATRNEL